MPIKNDHPTPADVAASAYWAHKGSLDTGSEVRALIASAIRADRELREPEKRTANGITPDQKAKIYRRALDMERKAAAREPSVGERQALASLLSSLTFSEFD